MIQPTPGRVVWYRPAPHEALSRIGDQPLAAIVAGVHSDRCVSLVVFDANGLTHSRMSVTLVQDGDAAPDWAHAEWMPYQKGQAAKAEQLERQAASSVNG